MREILTSIGTTHWYQGELDQAEGRFHRGAEGIAAGAGRWHPTNPELLYQLSTIDNNIGHVLEGRGRWTRRRRNTATCSRWRSNWCGSIPATANG